MAAALAAGQQKLGIVLALPDGNAGEVAALSDDLGGILGVVPFCVLENPLPFWSKNVEWAVDTAHSACYNIRWLA